MVDDTDARLARLRRAAYGPDAAPAPEVLAELAELERARAGASLVGEEVQSETKASSDAQRVDEVDATEESSLPSRQLRRRFTLRRPWAVLASAVVATALIASVAGYAVGSYRPTDSAAVAASIARIDEAVGTTAWLGSATTTMGWDVGSARLLGSVDDLSVLVTTKRDGEEWCGVLVRSGEHVTHQESCRRSATGVVGLEFAFGPSVQVERAAGGGFSFTHTRWQSSAALDGPLTVARDLLVETADWPVEDIVAGGMFSGVSVWGRLTTDDAMCLAFVRSSTRTVDEVGCRFFEDSVLSTSYALFESATRGEGDVNSQIVLSVQRIGDQLVTRADIREY